MVTSALTLALAGATGAAASADVSLEAGGFFGNGGTTGAGALSLGVFGIPPVPLAGELTFAAPFNGGYAATFDLRLNAAGTTIGAGAGFGSVGARATTGTLYDAILAHSIAPHTALEARVYLGHNRPSSVLAGLRFSI
jgi:hypothetical protein